jgi:hypothetical protein
MTCGSVVDRHRQIGGQLIEVVSSHVHAMPPNETQAQPRPGMEPAGSGATWTLAETAVGFGRIESKRKSKTVAGGNALRHTSYAGHEKTTPSEPASGGLQRLLDAFIAEHMSHERCRRTHRERPAQRLCAAP